MRAVFSLLGAITLFTLLSCRIWAPGVSGQPERQNFMASVPGTHGPGAVECVIAGEVYGLPQHFTQLARIVVGSAVCDRCTHDGFIIDERSHDLKSGVAAPPATQTRLRRSNTEIATATAAAPSNVSMPADSATGNSCTPSSP